MSGPRTPIAATAEDGSSRSDAWSTLGEMRGPLLIQARWRMAVVEAEIGAT
jgi:hypothetical protein